MSDSIFLCVRKARACRELAAKGALTLKDCDEMLALIPHHLPSSAGPALAEAQRLMDEAIAILSEAQDISPSDGGENWDTTNTTKRALALVK